MYLKSLTLKGFKSFPDRTRLDFTPGVSVIVGPNGSGKSNVTDAVLWALGEQSPLAVRGQSMQDVIFAGAHGQQARAEALVEVVLDNSDGAIDLPASEISISRRIDRSGEGEYRMNGARCRLTDVLEVLSDTGLGREMHSVVSQGRVEAIVTSKPRDRKMLIEEAAGLGKHRRRRRQAQLKLDRTQENLDRALDVEREARSRLKPLKRQAEAAEHHARLQRQLDEAAWELAREIARAAGAVLTDAEQQALAAREEATRVEGRLATVSERRAQAERALSTRAAEREALSARYFRTRTVAEKIELRQESAARILAGLRTRVQRRSELLSSLKREDVTTGLDAGSSQRVAALEAELAELDRSHEERRAQEVAELEQRRALVAEQVEQRLQAVRGWEREREKADAECEGARRARRDAEAAVDRARRDAARIGAELAAANQVLRLHAGAPGGGHALSAALSVEPGYELAVAAVLGPRLRAAVASDLGEAQALLNATGGDGGTALVRLPGVPASVDADSDGNGAPAPGAEPLMAYVRPADGAAAGLLAVLLADTWLVEDFEALATGFQGVAVTAAGRVWSASACELRQVPAGGQDRFLAERNRRDELVGAVDMAAQAEQAARARARDAEAAAAHADSAREEVEDALRAARRELTEGQERERHLRVLRQARERDDGHHTDVTRREELQSALNSERKLIDRVERERVERERQIRAEQARLTQEQQLVPHSKRLVAALDCARAAVAAREEIAQAELDHERTTGNRLSAELSEFAAKENRVQSELKGLRERVTQVEIQAQRARDEAADARERLAAVAERLGLESEPAVEALDEEARQALSQRVERLTRRREQLGPVNPLAEQEYAEALEHVEELERQRQDLEAALRELSNLIRDTDRRIRDAFDETFQAAARNFEEVVGQLFPGGRGRLRLVREDSGPRSVLGGDGGRSSAGDVDVPATDVDGVDQEAVGHDAEAAYGVEIEITPAGKATRRLSLLSGGEKSMTALAFLFAVFLARPCPFYILDEVEAALDDSNIDRFLSLLRRVSDRAQFVVVTHQRRTMEAADCLYGVSMAGNGVSKVISRRLPQEPPALSAA